MPSMNPETYRFQFIIGLSQLCFYVVSEYEGPVLNSVGCIYAQSWLPSCIPTDVNQPHISLDWTTNPCQGHFDIDTKGILIV